MKSPSVGTPQSFDFLGRSRRPPVSMKEFRDGKREPAPAQSAFFETAYEAVEPIVKLQKSMSAIFIFSFNR